MERIVAFCFVRLCIVTCNVACNVTCLVVYMCVLLCVVPSIVVYRWRDRGQSSCVSALLMWWSQSDIHKASLSTSSSSSSSPSSSSSSASEAASSLSPPPTAGSVSVSPFSNHHNLHQSYDWKLWLRSEDLKSQFHFRHFSFSSQLGLSILYWRRICILIGWKKGRGCRRGRWGWERGCISGLV